jgi:hypothetical protein
MNTHTEWCVILWTEGHRELADSFASKGAADCFARDCNRWAESQAGDAWFSVERYEVG